MQNMILDWEANSQFTEAELIAALRGLPTYVLASDERPAREQINERSASGWETLQDPNWKLFAENELQYGNMPPLVPVARGQHRGEWVIAYQPSLVVILHADKSFSVAKIS